MSTPAVDSTHIVLREQWKESRLRPIALVLAGADVLLITFVVVATYVPLIDTCATLNRVVTSGGQAQTPTTSPSSAGAVPTQVPSVVSTHQTTCNAQPASIAVLGILLGLFAILVLVEVATLLPGLKFSGAGVAAETPPAVAEATNRAYQGSVDEAAAYELSLGAGYESSAVEAAAYGRIHESVKKGTSPPKSK